MERKKFEGKWNGTESIEYEFVNYSVGKPEKPTWWMSQFVGQIRQGILVTVKSNGYQFLMDNEAGDAYHKIRNTDGSPRAGHRSVDNYKIESYYVSSDKWKTELNEKLLKEEHEEHMKYLEKNFPEDYRKLKALEKGLKNGFFK